MHRTVAPRPQHPSILKFRFHFIRSTQIRRIPAMVRRDTASRAEAMPVVRCVIRFTDGVRRFGQSDDREISGHGGTDANDIDGRR